MSMSKDRLLSQYFHQLPRSGCYSPTRVIPANHFNESVSKRERQFAVENTGVRVAHNIL